MSDQAKREEVAKVYENLRTTLFALAGQLTDASFEYRRGSKMAMLATQAASELYQATRCIKRSSLKKHENISQIQHFCNQHSDYLFVGLIDKSLYEEIKKNGHKNLAGHLKGARTYLIKLSDLYDKLDK